MILADDLGADDWSGAGNKAVRTPNLDQLASQGLDLSQCMLTCSSCSPSRSSIITSRYPHNTDAEQLHWPLPAAQITFVEKLKASGYYTAAAGKWHLGEPIKERFDLVKEASTKGFELPTGAINGKDLPVMQDKENASGCADWLKTLQDRPRDRPFFMWLAAFDPHRDYTSGTLTKPHDPQSVIVPPYLPDTLEVRKDLAMYYDEITRLDTYVGAVMQELDAQGIADNTVIAFLSDNGRPFPRCKTTLYESGIRTPLIVRWPAKIRGNQATSALVSTVDLGVTFLELAGLTADQRMQGLSFAKVLNDPGSAHRKYAFAEHNWHDFDALERGVRSARYKYIRNIDATLPLTPPADAVRSPTYETMRQMRDSGKLSAEQMGCFVKPRATEELYDLQSDPHELKNLALDPAFDSVLKEHRAELDKWRAETNDIDSARAPDEFDRETGKPLANRKRPRPTKSQLLMR